MPNHPDTLILSCPHAQCPSRTQVLEQYYPLQASKDVCFEIGRLLMGLKEYVMAVDFFKRSHEACGEHHVTWHNMGICFFYLDNFTAASQAFKRSLGLKEDYRESQAWLAKVCDGRVGGGGRVGGCGGMWGWVDGLVDQAVLGTQSHNLAPTHTHPGRTLRLGFPSAYAPRTLSQLPRVRMLLRPGSLIHSHVCVLACLWVCR